jgi:hypothetical protein
MAGGNATWEARALQEKELHSSAPGPTMKLKWDRGRQKPDTSSAAGLKWGSAAVSDTTRLGCKMSHKSKVVTSRLYPILQATVHLAEPPGCIEKTNASSNKIQTDTSPNPQ